MPGFGEREVVVVSNDGSIREEVSAAVASRPHARARFVAFAEALRARSSVRAPHVVVIDDEGQTDAVELVRRLKAGGRDAAVIYLASNHSPALEQTVRQAGTSFYAVKSARDGSLGRVLETLLARG